MQVKGVIKISYVKGIRYESCRSGARTRCLVRQKTKEVKRNKRKTPIWTRVRPHRKIPSRRRQWYQRLRFSHRCIKCTLMNNLYRRCGHVPEALKEMKERGTEEERQHPRREQGLNRQVLTVQVLCFSKTKRQHRKGLFCRKQKR